LRDPSDEVRARASVALSSMGASASSAVYALQQARSDGLPGADALCASAIYRISGKLT
jgi:hypothetical protein